LQLGAETLHLVIQGALGLAALERLRLLKLEDSLHELQAIHLHVCTCAYEPPRLSSASVRRHVRAG
jgi:hypothetical protein